MSRAGDHPGGGPGRVRVATPPDAAVLLELWASLFEEDGPGGGPWRTHARGWFVDRVWSRTDYFPVVEVDDEVVATAIGALDQGVPNPLCAHGRTVQLKNLVTRPSHRGRGYGTLLVRDVVRWARVVGADRVDLSATDDGRRIYEQVGFVPTSAPRMKLVL